MERKLLFPSSMKRIRMKVADFMSRGPYTIGAAQTLAAADRLMREHQLRHLPVLDLGNLVGIVSQRELGLLLTAPEIDADATPISRAMRTEVLVVEPDDLIAQVASKMAERRVGSAVVARGGDVVGVFTTVDAARADGDRLARGPLSSLEGVKNAPAAGRGAESASFTNRCG